jgi:C4-dicarboxylate-specific signal transduction histidine kinase
VRRVRRFVEKRDTQFSEVRVNRLVEEVVLLAKTELQQRHARVVLALGDDLPAVLGDSIQIEQVLMNLLRNGLEAMEETPQQDRIVCIRSMRYNDNRIRVDVCDAGSGIAGEDMEKLFEPFFTTKPDGMGMGLSIGRTIIQAHGGQLWASANHDRGSTFHFTLPVGGQR